VSENEGMTRMSETVEKVREALKRDGLSPVRKAYAKEIKAAFADEWAEAIVTILNAAPELLSLLDQQAKEIEELRDTLSMATAFHVTEIGQEEITVEWVGRALRLGGGPWAVRCGGMCLNREGEWDYELLPSSRRHDWLDAHRFDSREEAFAAACDAATAALKEQP
jgi:hypothetical protein